MEILDPGHEYICQNLDDNSPYTLINFVKREGEKYPGNVGHHAGTTIQEILRVLIDRTKYVDNQISNTINLECIWYYRMAIYKLEQRAASRHGLHLTLDLKDLGSIEDFDTCKQCGHIICEHNNQLRKKN